MKTALLVEDEPATLHFYRAGLRGLQGWRLLGAANGREALDILRVEPVDVLVTDLQMPVLDGYGLIASVHDLYPSIPIVVLTSLPEGVACERARSLGALKVLAKPVRLSLLMEELRSLGELESEGRVRGLTVGSLLQLMSWELKSCTLTVQSGSQLGVLYVRQGQLIHAVCADCEGLEAAYRILGWSQPEVAFVEACRVQPSIELPVAEVLMNAALLQDRARLAGEDPWGAE
nr:response regulator [uncultured Holophaga sp.]